MQAGIAFVGGPLCGEVWPYEKALGSRDYLKVPVFPRIGNTPYETNLVSPMAAVPVYVYRSTRVRDVKYGEFRVMSCYSECEVTWACLEELWLTNSKVRNLHRQIYLNNQITKGA